MKFWDASAIVPLLVNQRLTRTLMGLLDHDSHVVVWWGTSVECYSALMRLAREGNLDPGGVRAAEARLASLRQAWDEVLPNENSRLTAERMLRVHPLRAADSLQLAAALIATEHEPRRMDLVCLDERLIEAANKEGFNVLPEP